MAYMSQETKAKIKLALDAIKLPKAWKISLSVRNHSTLAVTIRQAPATALDDFRAHLDDYGNIRENFKHSFDEFETKGYFDINCHHCAMQFRGPTLKVIEKIIATVKTAGDWFDKSDSQSDYFHTAFYIDVQFGKWDRPCVFVGNRRTKSEAIAEVAADLDIPVIDIPLVEADAFSVIGFPTKEPKKASSVVQFPVIARPIPTDPAGVMKREINRAELVRWAVVKMKATPAGASLNDAALVNLAEAVLSVAFED